MALTALIITCAIFTLLFSFLSTTLELSPCFDDESRRNYKKEASYSSNKKIIINCNRMHTRILINTLKSKTEPKNEELHI